MTIHVTTEPVRLEGWQYPFKPSEQYNKHTLQVIIGSDLIDALTEERPAALDWARSKHKNASRAVEKFEPWEEVSPGQYQVKFSWKPEKPVPFVDAEGTPITEDIGLRSGSMVKIAFKQKPYLTPDSIGTKLELVGAQVISCASGAGVDTGSLSTESVADLFGKTEGFTVGEPNVTATAVDHDDDPF